VFVLQSNWGKWCVCFFPETFADQYNFIHQPLAAHSS